MKTVFEVAQTMTALVKIHIGTTDLTIWDAVVQAELIIEGEHAIRRAEVASEMRKALEAFMELIPERPPTPAESRVLFMAGAALRKAKGET